MNSTSVHSVFTDQSNITRWLLWLSFWAQAQSDADSNPELVFDRIVKIHDDIKFSKNVSQRQGNKSFITEAKNHSLSLELILTWNQIVLLWFTLFHPQSFNVHISYQSFFGGWFTFNNEGRKTATLCLSEEVCASASAGLNLRSAAVILLLYSQRARLFVLSFSHHISCVGKSLCLHVSSHLQLHITV